MKFNKAYFALIIALLPFLSQAQERGIPVYSDYLTDNLYLLHPSMAGAASANKIRLTARQQWFDVEDAPSLQTLSINGSLSEKIGMGAILFNDANGNFSQQGAYVTFAYHLMLGGSRYDLNMLSFGMNVGVGQEKLDETGLVGPPNPNDPRISGAVQSDAFFNVDFGLSYYFQEFFAHFTVKNIIPQQRDIFFAENTTAELTNQRQYVGSLGYVFTPSGSEWSFEPSVLVHMKDRTQETNLDGNIKAYRTFDFGVLWGGLSYRRSLDGAEYDGGGVVESQKLQYLTPFVGINYNNFMFAYTYSYQMNSVVLTNSGFHQITLGYNFGGDSGQFECNCPAINY